MRKGKTRAFECWNSLYLNAIRKEGSITGFPVEHNFFFCIPQMTQLTFENNVAIKQFSKILVKMTSSFFQCFGYHYFKANFAANP